MLPPEPHGETLSPRARQGVVLGTVGAHIVVGWALLQVPAVRPVAGERASVMVELIAPEPEAPKPAPPPPPKSQAKAPPKPAPIVAAHPPPVLQRSPVFEAPPPSELPPPPAPSTPPVQPAPPATPVPSVPPAPAPTAPRPVTLGETDWLRAPQLEYPITSKRAREEGTVLVRALIDARGVPRQVRLHRSSGFSRLDAEALEKALTARLKPRTENGQPVEFWALMPLAFELEN